MSESERLSTGADVLVRGLREAGVKVVFGYPGGPLMPLYDALYREPAIRHVLARDEQAAAFMADGYARATGDPGVCLAVCGPGVFNAATPLASAFTDSIPVLLISGQVPIAGRGLRSGYYHENDQLEGCATFTKWRGCAENIQSIPTLLERALTAIVDRRPGPALLEVPINVLGGETTRTLVPAPPTMLAPPIARSTDVEAIASTIARWQKPVMLVGGGVKASRAETLVTQIAERLGAPVFTTLMGKDVISWDHPLCAGLPWLQATSDLTNMAGYIKSQFNEADGMLAVGCRFSQVSTGNWTIPRIASLIQIDIDRSEIGRHYPVELAIHADARQSLKALLGALPDEPREPWSQPTTMRKPWRLPGFDAVMPLRRVLPRDSVIVADVTRLAYILLADFPVYQTRSFLHPAGFVAMGYGIPAAIGAKVAYPDRKVVAIVGDGGFMMSGMELATAVQEKLPIVVVLVNDRSLTLIKAIQDRRYEGRHIGVDLVNPDFGQLAKAFGVRHWSASSDPEFESALSAALEANEPAVVEVKIG
jgi:acetolactate synthase-1/2/3 large subunit